MTKRAYLTLFCLVLLAFAISGGKKKNIGAEAREVNLICPSIPCKTNADCKGGDPNYVCSPLVGCICRNAKQLEQGN
ncbi:unnamed protein product [Linum trigynum]|uniref:Uncharacterized protein n=1 Tax=Linum trigynum TaxID=586398 RepID=A0AAV2GQW8_9ROSI